MLGIHKDKLVIWLREIGPTTLARIMLQNSRLWQIIFRMERARHEPKSPELVAGVEKYSPRREIWSETYGYQEK
jgi:hypothetical protein